MHQIDKGLITEWLCAGAQDLLAERIDTIFPASTTCNIKLSLYLLLL